MDWQVRVPSLTAKSREEEPVNGGEAIRYDAIYLSTGEIISWTGGGFMADRKDKRSRKEALDRWKADQRAAARAKLPLPNEQMQAMFDMLRVEFPRQGCNHTLRLTQAWLEANGLPVDPVIAWLHENGGHCDCEVLANSQQAWRDAIHDVNW